MSTFLLVVTLTGRGVGGVLRARRAAAEDETVGVLLGVHRLIKADESADYVWMERIVLALITCSLWTGCVAPG